MRKIRCPHCDATVPAPENPEDSACPECGRKMLEANDQMAQATLLLAPVRTPSAMRKEPLAPRESASDDETILEQKPAKHEETRVVSTPAGWEVLEELPEDLDPIQEELLTPTLIQPAKTSREAHGVKDSPSPGKRKPGDSTPSEVPSVISVLATKPELKGKLPQTSHSKLSERGQALQTRYAVNGVLAEGGMGKVLLAEDVDIGREIAMKTLKPNFSKSPDFIARFLEEVQTTGQLEHPNIVPVHDIGINSLGEVYFTMKYVRGDTLKAIIKRLREGDKETHDKYSFTRRCLIMQQVCEAMAFAHSKGVIHRDLKPENIMVGSFGEVMVMDWGLAKVIGREERGFAGAEHDDRLPQDGSRAVSTVRSQAGGDSQTMAGTVMGTPGYMSPEQATGKVESLDQRSDIYALGCVMYELLTLQRAHPGENIAEIIYHTIDGLVPPAETLKNKHQGKVPRELSLIIETCMERDVDKRYASAHDIFDQLEAYLEGKSPVVCPHTALKRGIYGFGRFVDNHAKLVILTLVLFVMLAPMLGVLWYMGLLTQV